MTGLQACAVSALVLCIYVWAAVSRAVSLLGQERRVAALPMPGGAKDTDPRWSARNSSVSRTYRVEQDRVSGEWTLVPES